jgi:inner membrane protein
MDSLSHALVGVAVAGLSGHQPALGDPIYIAAVLGAQAPDFDIVSQVKGNMAYLRQHRAFSHSLPGVALWAAAIAAGVKLFLPQADSGQLLLWAFAGGLSHTFLDYFNSHGTAILWPFRRERKSYPLLNVFDPILMVLLLAVYATRLPMEQVSYLSFATLGIYIFARYYGRKKAYEWLANHFAGEFLTRIWVMPCLTRLFYWDFVVETGHRHINGRLGALFPLLEIKADLPRQELSPLAAQASKTSLGEFFTTFTPFIYFEERAGADEGKVNIYDLRYHRGGEFVHRATITFAADMTLRDAYIHSLGQTVKVSE